MKDTPAQATEQRRWRLRLLTVWDKLNERLTHLQAALEERLLTEDEQEIAYDDRMDRYNAWADKQHPH